MNRRPPDDDVGKYDSGSWRAAIVHCTAWRNGDVGGWYDCWTEAIGDQEGELAGAEVGDGDGGIDTDEVECVIANAIYKVSVSSRHCADACSRQTGKCHRDLPKKESCCVARQAAN